MDQPVTPLPLIQVWGFWALVMGALGVIAVFIQIAGPSLDPTPSVGTQIGEVAGEIRRAAWRSFFGMAQPEPEVVQVTWKDWLPVVGPVLGAIAVVLAVISGIRGEDRRFVGYGLGLGATAILFQFIWMVALLIVGVMLLIAILHNIGDIFSF
ncbi:MAG: hypothetical protein AAFQ64_10345 [Pseudomonadota bacterium]